MNLVLPPFHVLHRSSAPSFVALIAAALITLMRGGLLRFPVVNVLLALRELLMDRFVIEHIITWMVSSGIYAIAAALYAARQFKREDIVTSLS